MADEPVSTSYGAGNVTVLNIVFASSSIIMETEEEAASFESLVADIGGILGLFIGFNFLAVLEFLLVLGRNFLTGFCKKTTHRRLFNFLGEEV